MRRRLTEAFAILSLAVALVAGVFWVRSAHFTHSQVGESLSIRRTDPRWWIISHRGTVTLCRQDGRDWGKEVGSIAGLGFRFGGLSGPAGSLWNLAVPYWFILCASLVLPAWWLHRVRRDRRRSNNGRCRRCGYDLRATPQRCPECGSLASVNPHSG
jgi:hypothetical protein